MNDQDNVSTRVFQGDPSLVVLVDINSLLNGTEVEIFGNYMLIFAEATRVASETGDLAAVDTYNFLRTLNSTCENIRGDIYHS
jgi:hypothetical protein